MKILVSGGAGFIGSNLCERLVNSGHDVYCLDNLSTGARQNLSDFEYNANFHFIEGNATHPPDIPVDQIYSLASATAPGAYQADPLGTLEANIEGTSALLQMATRQKATMLFTSSIRVTEPLEDRSPHACYVDGKRKGEELCRSYFHNFGTDVKIARLFNTYGPRMALNDSRVVPQFIMRALTGAPLKIVGDGQQKDAFCYISDMLDGLIAYMNSDVKLGPIEFGYPVGISILELAHLAIKVAERVNGYDKGWNNEFPFQWSRWKGSPIVFNGIKRSAREMEIKKMRPLPDITEARAKLGWEPKVALEDGLFKLAEYYSKRMAA